MDKKTSKLETGRQKGKHQVEEQRASILDAAESLFLHNGLKNTRMIDIAAQAGITKITLYRYFPNLNTIAVEIHKRMIARIWVQIGTAEEGISLEEVKVIVRKMIRGFDDLRDAYRYIGMFDQLYLDNPLDSNLAQWTKHELVAQPFQGIAQPFQWMAQGQIPADLPQGNRIIMLINNVVWFLEKLALRGEMTWSDQAVPLETHLGLFEEMIIGYIDRSLAGE
jgi:AcrR family transcriptional regulator